MALRATQLMDTIDILQEQFEGMVFASKGATDIVRLDHPIRHFNRGLLHKNVNTSNMRTLQQQSVVIFLIIQLSKFIKRKRVNMLSRSAYYFY